MNFNIYIEGVKVPVHPIARKNNTVYIHLTGLDTEDIYALSVHMHDLKCGEEKATKELIDKYFSHDPEN